MDKRRSTKSPSPSAEAITRVVLVGNPNVGKSVIFGWLTGRYVTVSNYPGTTVEVTQGNSRKGGRRWMIIDTPGINNLIPMSEDERVTRDILLEPGDLKVIQVGDAKNIRRGLMITLQLAEMEKPVVLVLNMADEARERGITINAGGLAGILDIPVHLTIATRQKGLDAIIRSLNLGGERIPQTKLIYPEDFEESITQIEELFPPKHMGKRALALMLLSGDESLKGLLHTLLSESAVQRIEEIVHRLQRQYSTPLGVLINQKRLQAVDRILKGVFRKERWSGDTVHHRSLSDLTMHPIWGIPILLLVIYLLYKIVGDLGAGVGVQTMEKVVFGQFINPAVGWAVERFIPWKFWQDLLIGSYGLETMGLTYALAIVLPIVGAFFLAFGLLEDSGYLPRLAVMVNRIFKTMGLNGKAVLPMVLGLGCDTMATLTTRVLETKKERILVTLLLALGVPCSAQIGVMVGMFAKMSLGAIMVWGWVIVGSMILVGLLATKLIQGEKADFILEVPPLRIPTLGNILIKTLARLEWFVREAVPLFLLGTLLLFFLDRWGLLQAIQNWGAPIVVRFLGLPAKTTEVFLLGFVRRDYGAAGLYMMARAGELDPIQIVVSLVTITLFIPCLANFFMIIKERGWKQGFAMAAFIFPFALLVGGILNYFLRTFGFSL